MTCPKCEEGNIIRIKFKDSGRIAFLCDVCEALWFKKGQIDLGTKHTLKSYSQEEDLGYSIEELREEDIEHQPLPPSEND